MPKLQRAKTVACGLLRWDRCCIIVVSHWSKPAGQNMASLLVVMGFRTSHSMPKEESHVIFSKNLPLKGASLQVIGEVLRHRSVETTAHYAKVDVALLQQVVMPWPGAPSC